MHKSINVCVYVWHLPLGGGGRVGWCRRWVYEARLVDEMNMRRDGKVKLGVVSLSLRKLQ